MSSQILMHAMSSQILMHGLARVQCAPTGADGCRHLRLEELTARQSVGGFSKPKAGATASALARRPRAWKTVNKQPGGSSGFISWAFNSELSHTSIVHGVQPEAIACHPFGRAAAPLKLRFSSEAAFSLVKMKSF